MTNHTLPSLLFFLLFCQSLFAQIPPPCPNPAPPGTEDCFSTCVYCDLDGYIGINNGTPSGGNFICGQIAIHNDQWFGFMADSNTITISVQASNCQNGDGLQIAIFANCGDADAIICNAGNPGGAGSPLTLTYPDFIIGKTYYLMVDGWSGDVCDYQIDVTDGSVNPGPPDDAPKPQGPSVVCPNATVLYTVPDVPGAGSYLWTAPPGAQINGAGSSLNVAAPEGATVTVTFGNAGGNVCVQAANACNPASVQACLSVVNQPIPPTILPPVTVCNEYLPYVWPEEPYPTISNPGTFVLTSAPYASYIGCDSIVKQTIVVNAPNTVNLGTKYICEGSCFSIGGSLYCTSGNYAHVLTSSQGCDSLVVFTIAVLSSNSAAEINTPLGKTITCSNPELMLQSSNPPNTVHLWKNNAGDTLGTGSFITVTTAGFYTHDVTITAGGVNCSAQSKVLIKQNNTPPPVTATGGTIDASHPTVQLMGHSIISGVNYFWVGPNGFTSNQKNPVVSVPGFYTLTVTHPHTGCSNSITVEVTMMN